METGEQAERACEHAKQLVPCEKNRLLIVDDEPGIRSIFKQILSASLPGCVVDVATNGAEAIESFKTGHHTVLLMDLHMPVMDGETAFRKLEELCETENREMPSVVFCAGYEPSYELHKVIANSRRHFILRKPVTNEMLLDTIKVRLEMNQETHSS